MSVSLSRDGHAVMHAASVQHGPEVPGGGMQHVTCNPGYRDLPMSLAGKIMQHAQCKQNQLGCGAGGLNLHKR